MDHDEKEGIRALSIFMAVIIIYVFFNYLLETKLENYVSNRTIFNAVSIFAFAIVVYDTCKTIINRKYSTIALIVTIDIITLLAIIVISAICNIYFAAKDITVMLHYSTLNFTCNLFIPCSICFSSFLKSSRFIKGDHKG